MHGQGRSFRILSRLRQYDLQTEHGKISAGFLYTFGVGLSTAPQKLFCYIGIPNGASEEQKAPAML